MWVLLGLKAQVFRALDCGDDGLDMLQIIDILLGAHEKSTCTILLTSASPTNTTTLLPPFGTTCARSPNRILCLLSFFSCTLTPSSSSGLNRPPVRSFDRSSWSLVRVF